MLHAGLDLSRKRIDVCLLSDQGELIEELACPPDRDGLRGLARRVGRPRRAGGRGDRVDDRRPLRPRHPRVAGLGGRDRRRRQGQGPGAVGGEDDRIDARVLALLSQRDLVPAICTCPTRGSRRSESWPCSRLHLVKHRSPAEAPDPLDPDQLRAPLPGLGPVRGGRPRAARKARAAGALGRATSWRASS